MGREPERNSLDQCTFAQLHRRNHPQDYDQTETLLTFIQDTDLLPPQIENIYQLYRQIAWQLVLRFLKEPTVKMNKFGLPSEIEQYLCSFSAVWQLTNPEKKQLAIAFENSFHTPSQQLVTPITQYFLPADLEDYDNDSEF